MANVMRVRFTAKKRAGQYGNHDEPVGYYTILRIHVDGLRPFALPQTLGQGKVVEDECRMTTAMARRLDAFVRKNFVPGRENTFDWLTFMLYVSGLSNRSTGKPTISFNGLPIAPSNIELGQPYVSMSARGGQGAGAIGLGEHTVLTILPAPEFLIEPRELIITRAADLMKGYGHNTFQKVLQVTG